MGKLSGKVAIVTGAGRGIGRGIATKLAAEGASVVVASRTQQTVDEVVDQLTSSGYSALGVTVDVASRERIEQMVASSISAFGTVDILVNNAQSWGTPGANQAGPPMNLVEDFDEVGWDYAYQTGLKGSLYGMAAVLPAMKSQSWGRVINLYSPAAQQASPGLAAYNCAKEAILSLTRTAAREWASYGITVNCLTPAIENDAVRSRLSSTSDPEAIERVRGATVDRIPMGRMGDAEEDAGSAAAFLASDEAKFVTGVALRVDGGLAI
jgi:NAD(P)-dependent dehydrogenase (short-subunit alcohol dehydrogenase family)